MFFALLSTHMFPCNKTLQIVNVPQPNYMYCNHKFLCMWLSLGSRSRSPSYMCVLLLYPNIFCAKFAMHKKNHGNLKWTLEYLKPNELCCGIYRKSFHDFHALLASGLVYDAVKTCKMKP